MINRHFQKSRRAIGLVLVAGMVLMLSQCGGIGEIGKPTSQFSGDAGRVSGDRALDRKYAAELLSYLMQVVVGVAGDPGTRQAWKTKSLSVTLDYHKIADIMKGPERQPSVLMVYDANILGLSSVLYHYNPRLNFFKGEAFQESVYPSEELLAIRLLIVQKIARGEKVSMGNLMTRATLLEDPLEKPSDADLAAVNLSGEELQLLRDVIRSEPFFKDYLEDPFVVEALYRVGMVEMDGYVKSKIQAADYKNLVEDRREGEERDDVVRVAILPSMTNKFVSQAKDTSGFPPGFRATGDYNRSVGELKRKLKASLQRQVLENLAGSSGAGTAPEASRVAAGKIVDTHLQFIDLNKRPLVIYPGNAEKVIQALCPDADFNFILLGKNVYLSIYFDAHRDIFPYVNRVYLDIKDIHRFYSNDDIDQAGEFLFKRLRPLIELDAGGLKRNHTHACSDREKLPSSGGWFL